MNRAMKRYFLQAFVIFFFIALTIFLLASKVNLSALPEPGKMESYIATKAKYLLIQRSSRYEVPPSFLDIEASVADGDKLYGVECAACHGMDGHTPTDAGRWMYPRAADLLSPQVQRYSDAQMFWIIKNGIRLSGMPAFGKVESDEHIWNLVHYVRSLHNSTDQTISNLKSR